MIEYLGIKIDPENNKLLDAFSQKTIEDRYLWKDETNAQEAFARASIFCATYRGVTDYNFAQRLYSYVSKLWCMFSTPILSNGGTTRGLPISCFLNYVPDSRVGLSAHYDENIWLASSGGGIGGLWADVRSNGVDTSNGSRSTGSVPFMGIVDRQMLAFNQGTTRRGSYAAYNSISHPEISEFIAMRKSTGGDINRKCLNLHHGVTLTDEFLNAVVADSDWRLIDPKTNEAREIVSARDLWFSLLHTRNETGEPFMINLDRCNEALPEEQKNLGLKVQQSNLCSEITLPTNEERTAVCCLSSVNLETFDDWVSDDQFIPDMIRALDNVIEHFVGEITSKPEDTFDEFKAIAKRPELAKAGFSAYRERSLGLGAMGFHAYLQDHGVEYGSLQATVFNHKAFGHIKTQANMATYMLGAERGEAPDMRGTGRRNAHLLAIAPNASSSIICGNTSPSIEPRRANVFVHKTLSGSFQVWNKALLKLLKSKLNKEELEQVKKQIFNDEGSVMGVECLTPEEKAIFATAPEINQDFLVTHAIERQDYICQAQSLNLFFIPPKASAPQEVHNEFLQYVSDVHMKAMRNLKSLYYYRTKEARSVENVDIKIPKINLDEVCLACE